MPCESGPSFGEGMNRKQEVDTLTAMLCEMCQRFVDNPDIPLQVQSWYECHKEDDRKRKEQEQKHRQAHIADMERRHGLMTMEIERARAAQIRSQETPT